MNVLQLGPYPPPHGGIQTNLVAIKRYLKKHNLHSGVVNLTRHRKTPEDGVYYPKDALELMRLLIRLPHQILHMHFGGDLTRRNLGLFLFLTSLPQRKTILSFHSGGFPSSPQGRAARPASFPGWVLRRFDRIVAVNSQIAEVMLRYGIPPERVRIIPPHASDLSEKVEVLPDPLSSFYASHDPALLTVGLLEPEYDLTMQIDLLGAVREHYPKAGLIICGSGSLEADLRMRIAEHSWAQHILLAGDVSHGVVLRAIEQARILLRTTLYDGDAISVREALYLGTSVIATDNGMRPPGLRLIPPADPERLKETLLEELRSPHLSRKGSGNGMENLQSVLELYQELTTELATGHTKTNSYL